MPDFALLALPGAYLSSVGAFADSFLLARDRIEHVFHAGRAPMETQLRLLSVDGAPVELSGGSLLNVDHDIDTDQIFSFIWLPAFRIGTPQRLKARLAAAQPLLAWLNRQSAGGAVIGASGPACALLIAAGMTHGLTIPVARAVQPVVRGLFPHQRFDDRLGLYDNGSLLIANGLGNDIALILRAFERMISPEIVRWLISVMGIQKDEQFFDVADQSVSRAQLWLEQHFTEAVRIETLGALMACSAATVNRRFHAALGMSPKAYLQKLRLESAIRMLERSNRSVDKIAELVGYSDSRVFRSMFRQQTGITATQWRVQNRASKSPQVVRR